MFHKIYLIAKREFLTRVKKKSFLVMTLVSPLLILLFYGLIFYFSFNKDIGEDIKTIVIVDDSALLEEKLQATKTIQFVYSKGLKEDEARAQLEETKAYAILFIKKKGSDYSYDLIGNDQPSLGIVSTLEEKIEQTLKDKQLKQNGINQDLLNTINQTDVNLNTRKITQEGLAEGNSGLTTAIGYAGAILIYLFVFLYGVQVMRGVIEEKTNRIVEVIVSSVKPFELMMGKILGIAMVGLTQFLIWVGLVIALSGPVSNLVMDLTQTNSVAEVSQQMDLGASNPAMQKQMEMAKPKGPDFLKGMENINIPLILGMFVFYFISGYLFYGALFAAIGSAVDNETDTQQFMLPVTMPLIFSFVLAQTIVTNGPNSDLSIWLSMIPFSSPIIMMVRLPFGIPPVQIIASMVSMVAGFVFTVWLAGRIYRIGILTYGKKPSYKELMKWLFRKN